MSHRADFRPPFASLVKPAPSRIHLRSTKQNTLYLIGNFVKAAGAIPRCNKHCFNVSNLENLKKKAQTTNPYLI